MARRSLKSADDLARVGLHHHRAGNRAQAERSYRSALVRDPQNQAALTLLGTLLMEQADYVSAVPVLEHAARLAPDSGALFSNLGECLRRLGRKQEALVAFERAVEESPELAGAHYNLGLVLEQLGRLPEAIAAYEAALQLQPGLGVAAVGLLGALRQDAQYERAIDWYRRHARALSDGAALRCAVAGALADVFRIDEAVEHFEWALQLEPGSAHAHAELGAALAERGEIAEALEHVRKAVELEPENATYHSHLVYLMPLSPGVDSAQVLDEAKRFGERHTAPLKRPPSYRNDPQPARRLRIGYVSPDLRTHPVALFLLPLLRHHDRARVEVFCYSNVRRPDAVTAEIRSLAAHFRDIAPLDDDSAAALVRDDGIDVLVDLAMHSANHRLLLFGRKPAPVQVCWLAYPGTTGVVGMDYRLTDPQLDPPLLGAAHSTEVPLALPHTFWCYAPLGEQPEVSELPALTTDHVTFGSFNSFKKVNDASLALWADVLRAVPAARLLMVAPGGKARQRVQRALAERGVDQERVELLHHVPRPEYLTLHQRVDLCLDTTPYNGGTTSLDAWWMGVPVLSLAGSTPPSRAGASLAHNLGLSAVVVATSPQDFVERAVGLTSDLPKLAELRRGMRARMQASPLMDMAAFAHDLEQALAAAWRCWCERATAR